jgi:hypothetical protein
MKIQLTINLPIEKEHDCKKGDVFEAEYEFGYRTRGNPVIFIGKSGKKVKAFSDEYTILLNHH